MTDDSLSAAARAWAEASCASQGLPVHVADLGILSQVAGLLGAAPGVSRVAPRRSAAGSGAPVNPEPVRVEAVVAASGGCDGDVVDEGRDDRVLPG